MKKSVSMTDFLYCQISWLPESLLPCAEADMLCLIPILCNSLNISKNSYNSILIGLVMNLKFIA